MLHHLSFAVTDLTRAAAFYDAALSPLGYEGFHVAFRGPSQTAVTAFYRAALEQGGRDNGGVGFHPEHGPDYFAAFVFDPDGHRIEAVLNAKVS